MGNFIGGLRFRTKFLRIVVIYLLEPRFSNILRTMVTNPKNRLNNYGGYFSARVVEY